MPKIEDDIGIEQLQEVMGFVKQGDAAHEDVAETVHTLLRRYENVFYRDIRRERVCFINPPKATRV